MYYSRAVFDQSFFTISLPTLSVDVFEIGLNTYFSENTIVESSYYFKLITATELKPRFCLLMAKYNDKKIVGYSLIDEKSAELAFHDSNLNQKISTFLLYCKSVKSFTIKYIDADNGYHKRIDLLSDDII
jgi:hypothetical protein